MCGDATPKNTALTSASSAKPETTRTAADKLALLMERQMNLSTGLIDPDVLRLFIVAYWSRVSHLAHVIHKDEV